jgi:hypothetical protein
MQEAAPPATLPPLPSIPDADLLTPGSAEYEAPVASPAPARAAAAPALRAV